MPNQGDFIAWNDHFSGPTLKVEYWGRADFKISIQPIKNCLERAIGSLLEPYCQIREKNSWIGKKRADTLWKN